jgi:O-antigen/teichoic acid export membrane protein
VNETTPGEPRNSESRKQVRGSGILLVGRVLALGIAFFTQVLIVRYLAKGEYGAFAYGLSVASVGSSLAAFGMDKTAGRYLPIYQERGDRSRMAGTIVMALASNLAIGLGLAIGFWALHASLAGTLINDPRAVDLLLILVLLIPIQAVDSLLLAVSAVFVGARLIFFRRHLLAPILQLGAALAVIALAADGTALAIGWVVAGVVGIASLGVLLLRFAQRQVASRQASMPSVVVPGRELVGHAAPLMAGDLVLVLRGSMVVVLLEFLRSTIEVASFRAVLPLARLNNLIFQSGTLLFLPMAARFQERDDHAGLRAAYWRSAAWLAIGSLPSFLITFAAAGPVVELLFGPAYRDAGPVLSILALGFYVHGALGLAGLTLRAYGLVRYLLIVDLGSAVLSILAYALLIPPLGAVGAAVGTTTTLILQAVLYQVGLHHRTPVKWHRRYTRLFAVLGACAIAITTVQWVLHPPLVVLIVVVGVCGIAIARMNRGLLDAAATFPEVFRIPAARWILGD